VALRVGSVPEVVADGRSGVICDSPDELPLGIDKAVQLRAADCHDHAANHFDRGRMATGYERVYRQVSR